MNQEIIFIMSYLHQMNYLLYQTVLMKTHNTYNNLHQVIQNAKTKQMSSKFDKYNKYKHKSLNGSHLVL